jgi:type I restriction enzyme S subunit
MIGFNSPSITNNQFESTILPLPPLAEQHAIVEKIESLMKSVDQLETQVQERKRYAEDLLQSVLREAFEG